MEAWAILRHAIAVVFGNLGAALRISALPLGISVAVTFIAAPVLTGNEAEIAAALRSGRLTLAQVGLFIALWFVVTLWIAVRWHRFVLADAPPAMLPGQGREMLGYALRTLGIVVMMALAGGVLGFVLGFLGAALRPPGWVAQAVVFLFTFLGMMVSLRLSVSLPAMALGERVTLLQGWRALRHRWGTLAVLAAVAIAPQWAFGTIQAAFGASALWPGIWIVATWVSILFGLSLLTTLYGHFVQGRPLSRA